MRTTSSFNATSTSGPTGPTRGAALQPTGPTGPLTDAEKQTVIHDANAWLMEHGGAHMHQRLPVMAAVVDAVSKGKRTATVDFVNSAIHNLPEFEGFRIVPEHSDSHLSELQQEVLAKGKEIAAFEATHLTAAMTADVSVAIHLALHGHLKPQDRPPLDARQLDGPTRQLISLRMEREQLLRRHDVLQDDMRGLRKAHLLE